MEAVPVDRNARLRVLGVKIFTDGSLGARGLIDLAVTLFAMALALVLASLTLRRRTA